jgi:hypothetical protein
MRITQLPDGGTALLTDQFPVARGGENFRVGPPTANQITAPANAATGQGARTLADIRTDVRYVTDWGDPVTRTSFQAAIDRCAADKVRLRAPDGLVLLLDGSLYARQGLRLDMGTAQIVRTWNGGQSFGSGILTQENWAGNAKVSDVHVKGGVWTGNGFTGRVIEMYGDDCEVEDIRINGWGTASTGAMAILMIGDGFLVRKIRLYSPGNHAGADGVHIAGGANWRVEDIKGDAPLTTSSAFSRSNHRPAFRPGAPTRTSRTA